MIFMICGEVSTMMSVSEKSIFDNWHKFVIIITCSNNVCPYLA